MKKIAFFLVVLLLCSQAYSFDMSSLGAINSAVIDTAGVLKPEQKLSLESKIAELRKKYTIEVLTIIIPTTNDEDIASLANEIGQKVGVGKADKDNGLVLLIAINDRAWNIATGYGMEGTFPDLLTKRIGEKNFVLFRDSRYYDGILGSLNDFDKVLSGDTSIVSAQGENTGTNESAPWFFVQLIIALSVSGGLFKSLVKSKEYKKLFLYLLIAYIITLPLAYFVIPNIFFIGENIGVWAVSSLFGIFGKSGNGGGRGGSLGGGGSSGISFGGGGFGGGGSSGKW